VLPPAAYDPVFTTAVWQDYRAPLAEYDTPLRSRIGFYGLPGPARLEFRDAAGLYAWLDGSPFVSLYASQSWAEDLAEAVAWYHYVTVMGGTYTLLVPNGGGGQRALSPAAKIAARAGWKSVLEHMYAD
jgi:hypothetical protein